MFYQWNESMSVGVPLIDDDHKARVAEAFPACSNECAGAADRALRHGLCICPGRNDNGWEDPMMTRNAAIGMLLREMAEEMPVVLRALPDDRLWSVMVAGLMANNDVDELAEKIADMPVAAAGPADWREVYGALRDMVNETAVAR